MDDFYMDEEIIADEFCVENVIDVFDKPLVPPRIPKLREKV
jgi:hypothetical protein